MCGAIGSIGSMPALLSLLRLDTLLAKSLHTLCQAAIQDVHLLRASEHVESWGVPLPLLNPPTHLELLKRSDITANLKKAQFVLGPGFRGSGTSPCLSNQEGVGLQLLCQALEHHY
ncbi:unnamed protein product [Durusdinium trenchii]|uniref:Uncharacterized protein n=2 Tax=Durusdinium trenchii TaxID=1381693 RepID=A0ABP0QGL7_9DINO